MQSVWTFTRVLAAGKGKGKRQLDCAGVVTTTLAVCQALAQDANHTDLASCRFQVCCQTAIPISATLAA